jgi:hypothetical protein
MKCVAGDVTLDVGKKIFVCRDTKGRRSILPFDLKCAAGVDIRKSADRTLISFYIPIALDSHPPASGDQNDAGDKQDGDLLHWKHASYYYDAMSGRFGFKKNRGRRQSCLQLDVPCGLRPGFAQAGLPASRLLHNL